MSTALKILMAATGSMGRGNLVPKNDWDSKNGGISVPHDV